MNIKSIIYIPSLILLLLISVQCIGPKAKQIKHSKAVKQAIPKPKLQTQTKFVVKHNVLTDIDGNTYNSVVIGNNEWLTSNLRVTHYNDGTPIHYAPSAKEWSSNSRGPSYSYVNNDKKLKSTYGLYYDHYVLYTKKLCPKGWHIATDDEWVYGLMRYARLIMEDKYYKANLRSSNGWTTGFGNGNDKYKLNILPTGYRKSKENVVDFGAATAFWTDKLVCLFDKSGGMSLRRFSSNTGLPVRCVKDKVKPDVVTDIDGNTYSSVVIGDNEWLTTNLRTTRLKDGSPIKFTPSYKDWSSTNIMPRYSWVHQDSSIQSTHGFYYNYTTVETNKLCPSGWDIASEKDWKGLMYYTRRVLCDYDYFENLRASTGWGDNMKGKDTYKLSILPSGLRRKTGRGDEYKYNTGFWTGRNNNEKSTAVFMNPAYGNTSLEVKLIDERVGLTVRCVKHKEN